MILRNPFFAGLLARLARRGGGRANLLMVLLPFALRWVRSIGGLGPVLKRFQQQGYGRQAQSWVAAGGNQTLDEHAIHEVVGQDELERLSRDLGVPQHEVADGFARILPEVVDGLSPGGELPAQADAVLEGGREELEAQIAHLHAEERA
jgi:uncharacterized protein YidB (DUF937 family)